MKNFTIFAFLGLIISGLAYATPPTKVLAPAKLDAEVINSTTAKLTWEGSKSDYGYRIRTRVNGRITWTYFTIVAPSSVRRLSNLKPGTKYEWQIQIMFSESRRDTSYFVSGPSFTTDSDCDKPGNLESQVIGSSKVVLRWEYMSAGAVYEVKIKARKDSSWITYNTASNNLIIDNLAPSKEYEWKMTAYCDGNLYGGHSVPSDTGRFATAFSYEGGGDFADQKVNTYENNSWQSEGDINYVTFLSGKNNSEGNDKASLINSVGQVLNLPMYYKSTNGYITFDIDESLPPGVYTVKYISGEKLFNKTILIAGN